MRQNREELGELGWFLVTCAALFVLLGLAAKCSAQSDYDCVGIPPDCPYGRSPVCHCFEDVCEWYCEADRDHYEDQYSQACDPDCAPDDPICIPCDLEFAGQVCTTTCRWSHLYGRQICTTTCRETNV